MKQRFVIVYNDHNTWKVGKLIETTMPEICNRVKTSELWQGVKIRIYKQMDSTGELIQCYSQNC